MLFPEGAKAQFKSVPSHFLSGLVSIRFDSGRRWFFEYGSIPSGRKVYNKGVQIPLTQLYLLGLKTTSLQKVAGLFTRFRDPIQNSTSQ